MQNRLAAIALAAMTTIGQTAQANDADWTGFYLGIGLSTGDFKVETQTNQKFEFNLKEDFTVHAGYLHDFGKFVLGGEFERINTGYDFDNGSGELFTPIAANRLKLRFGYDLDRFLPYLILGYGSLIAFDQQLKDEGIIAGVGLDYRVSDRVRVGAEYTRHSADSFNGLPVDFSTDLFAVRLSIAF